MITTVSYLHYTVFVHSLNSLSTDTGILWFLCRFTLFYRASACNAYRARYCWTDSVCLSVCPMPVLRVSKQWRTVTLFDSLLAASFYSFYTRQTYRPDALLVTQPTVSQHSRNILSTSSWDRNIGVLPAFINIDNWLIDWSIYWRGGGGFERRGRVNAPPRMQNAKAISATVVPAERTHEIPIDSQSIAPTYDVHTHTHTLSLSLSLSLLQAKATLTPRNVGNGPPHTQLLI